MDLACGAEENKNIERRILIMICQHCGIEVYAEQKKCPCCGSPVPQCNIAKPINRSNDKRMISHLIITLLLGGLFFTVGGIATQVQAQEVENILWIIVLLAGVSMIVMIVVLIAELIISLTTNATSNKTANDYSVSGILMGLACLAVVMVVPSLLDPPSSPRPHYRHGTTVHTKNGTHHRKGTFVK